MYKLTDKDSKSGARRRIFEDLARREPKETGVILVFGEIDIMEHIYKNIYRHNKNENEMIDELAQKYISFTEELKDKGYLQ